MAGGPFPLQASLPHPGSSVTLDCGQQGPGRATDLLGLGLGWALCVRSGGPCSALGFNLLVSRADQSPSSLGGRGLTRGKLRLGGRGLTSVCTMAGLWVRSIFTVWKMSTTPSYRIRSSTMLSVMKTPVLPTPALQGEAALRGTTGQAVRPQADGWSPRPQSAPLESGQGLRGQLTCSGQRWGRPGRTAPWSCALGR